MAIAECNYGVDIGNLYMLICVASFRRQSTAFGINYEHPADTAHIFTCSLLTSTLPMVKGRLFYILHTWTRIHADTFVE